VTFHPPNLRAKPESNFHTEHDWRGACAPGSKTDGPGLMFDVSCLEKFGSMPRRQFESCALHEEEIAWNYIFYGAD
jgi:hypothetical protein